MAVDKPLAEDVKEYPVQKKGHEGLWQEWAKRCGQSLTLFIGDSQDPKIVKKVTDLAEWGYDFLYIDGDHEESSVRADVENYGSLVRDGGVVGFHDIKLPGVKPVWEELKRDWKTKEIVLKDAGTGTGVLYRSLV